MGTDNVPDDTELYDVEAGVLHLPTGRVAACDPIAALRAPFALQVPPGDYVVELTIGRFPEGERVALATLWFSRGEPVRWEQAAHPSERSTHIVDSGISAFMDAGAVEHWTTAQNTATDPRPALMASFDEEEERTWSGAQWGSPKASVIAFSAGRGDGAYTSHVGYGEDGTMLCLITDFELLAGKDRRDSAEEPGAAAPAAATEMHNLMLGLKIVNSDRAALGPLLASLAASNPSIRIGDPSHVTDSDDISDVIVRATEDGWTLDVSPLDVRAEDRPDADPAQAAEARSVAKAVAAWLATRERLVRGLLQLEPGLLLTEPGRARPASPSWAAFAVHLGMELSSLAILAPLVTVECPAGRFSLDELLGSRG